MSWNPAIEPGCPDEVGIDAIETLIIPRSRDLGDFEVCRALPAPKRQMVGPFIFFDQAGPAEFLPWQGVDVRPRPHTGLGTVTYLFRGDFHHRDSTGADQIIRPGGIELNGRRARCNPFGAHVRSSPKRSEQPVRDSDLAGSTDVELDAGGRLPMQWRTMEGSWRYLARPKRFELLTPRFVVWCSIQLSYGRATGRA